jgi:hypothetical protein
MGASGSHDRDERRASGTDSRGARSGRIRARTRLRAEDRNSPEAVRRRRTRTWLLAVIAGLGVAVIAGLLLPVDQANERAIAPTLDRHK